MSSTLIKMLFLMSVCFFAPIQRAHAHLTKENEQKYLKELLLPQNHQIQKGLNVFFNDPDVQALFIKLKKGARFNPWTGMGKKLAQHPYIQKKRLEAKNDWQEKKDLWLKIQNKYDVKDINGNNNLDALKGSIVLFSEKQFPGYVVKIDPFYWFDNIDYEKTNTVPQHSVYQGISSAFYAYELSNFVSEKNLTFIYPLKEYLFHLPGQPETLSVDNYVVVSEYVDKLPTEKESSTFFTSMGGQRFKTDEDAKNDKSYGYEPYGIKNEKDIELIAELLYVIEWLGIWDVNPSAVFYIKKNESLKIVFINLQKPGLGGGEDINFFYKSDEWRYRNGTHCGVYGLIQELLGWKRNPKILIDKKWKITAKKGKENEANEQQKKDSLEMSEFILGNYNILNPFQEVEDLDENNKIHDSDYYSWKQTIEKKNYLWIK